MDISKTQFKEYSKCENYAYLEKIHKYRGLFDDRKAEYIELLKDMFDEQGNDLIEVTNEQLEVMQYHYKETERYALKFASKILNKPFNYYDSTKDQKRFSFKDQYDNVIYTYVDGYYEDDNTIYIVEVKATSSSNFNKIGYKQKGEFFPTLEFNNGIYELKKNLGEKELKTIEKCFNRFDSVGKYFYDFAITKYIITQELIEKKINKKVKSYLCILNNKFTFNGKYIDGNPDYFNPLYEEPLFNIIDSDYILDNYYELIHKEHMDVVKNIVNDTLVSNYKKACGECIFEKLCFKQLSDLDNIKTLYKIKKIGKDDIPCLIKKGYYTIQSLPKELITYPIHIIQREALDSGKDYVLKEKIANEIKNIKYPIYHLDFESACLPLPRFYKEHPYSQSLFQFSLHIEKEEGKCDRYLDNHPYLAPDYSDRREELVKELIRLIDLSNGGTVLVYNDSFEKNRIKELIDIYPQYQNQLQTIYDHIYDLRIVLRGLEKDDVNYYSPLLHGKYSIKSVLPIFSNLKYSDLDIHNGSEANITYNKFRYLPKEEIEILRKQLLEYCGLDTYSMVIILQNIKKRLVYEQEKTQKTE